MSGFGNYLGATMGTSKNENGQSGAVYDNSFVTNSNYPQRAALVGKDGEFVQTPDISPNDGKDPIKADGTPFKVDSALLGEVPGLTSDNTAYQEIQDKLHGPSMLNWEDINFADMRAEKESLNVAEIDKLATAWTEQGETLKSASEDFKKTVDTVITGHWSGDSATAAEAASKQVTKTSIYDFTSASDAISNRLRALSSAFADIKARFPNDADDKLIDDGKFNKAGLQAKITDFNGRYHIDGSGHLRNTSDGYVTAADVIKELEKINLSIKDYTTAVQLFRDNYNPVVAAVAQNFPNLPTPPNMKFGDPTGPGGDPTGPGGGGGGTSPIKPGGGSGIKPFDPSALDKLKTDKPIDLDKNKPIDQKPTDQNDSKTDPIKDALESLSDPIKSAIDSATNAAKDAAGQLADAMKNAGQNPLGEGLKGPPEGVLGLGPQGLGGAGAGAGKGGGGAGGGVPLRGLPSSLPTGAPATTAAKVTAPAAAAGLGAGAGSPAKTA